MHTKPSQAKSATRKFAGLVKGALAEHRLSVTALAEQIGKSRNAVSRAINRGDFPHVQSLIRNTLQL